MEPDRPNKLCSKCGAARPKLYRGDLCSRCFGLETGRAPHSYKRLDSKLSESLSRTDLERQYVDDELSLADIAQKYHCTRQNIQKLLRRHGIRRRNRSQARVLALTKGKLSVSLVDAAGQTREVLHTRRIVQPEFFSMWTPAMAYVLGVIYTDGCLARPRGPMKHRLTMSQKEPELLEKVLALMGSNAKITFTKARGIAGAVHHFGIDSAEIYADLLRLGLTPKKSLTLTFPDMPSEYVRHFIRGCWDGDGSVSWERSHHPRPRASYVSGSKIFVEELVRHLGILGLPDRTIYIS